MVAESFSPATPLIGRNELAAQVRELITSQGARLLVLTGPPGIGKSRLARELIAQLAPQFADGAYFIPLANVDDPALVFPAIAHALGLPNDGVSPVTERLHARLAASSMFLALDSLEHTPSVVPDLVRLLDGCPGVRILIANRMPLRAPSVVEVPVPPLAVPDALRSVPEESAANTAVELLLRRARLAAPQFAATNEAAPEIVQICAQLEGIPLAIELAAPWLRQVSPADLQARLSLVLANPAEHDLPLTEQEQALHATMVVSEQMLSPEAQICLRRLAVFPGDFDTAAAVAMCENSAIASDSPTGVMAALAELTDHALLQRVTIAGMDRIVMPGPVREFAFARLQRANEARALRRHANHVLEELETAIERDGHDQLALTRRLEIDDENVRAALAWSLAEAPEVALRLASALWPHWESQGWLRQGQRWLERALAAPVAEKSPVRVRALHGLAVLAAAMGELERAFVIQGASLSLSCEIGDALGELSARAEWAMLELAMGGDADRARDEIARAADAFHLLGDWAAEGRAISALGAIAESVGDRATATRRFAESLAMADDRGDLSLRAVSLVGAAGLSRANGEADRAAEDLREALALSHRLGGQHRLVSPLVGLAGVAVDLGEYEYATRLFAFVTALTDALHVRLSAIEQARFDRDVALVRGALPTSVFASAWTMGRSLSIDAAVAEAMRRRPPLLVEASSHDLTRREIEVLRLLAAGNSDREIAGTLFISVETATSHVKNIRRKLGVHSRSAATAHAIRHGLV
jgi:non-specific serine/threonine protein kinase